MKKTTLKAALFFLGAAAILSVQPAYAEKGGRGHKPEKSHKEKPASEESNVADDIESVVSSLFGEKDRDLIKGFLKDNPREFCPPGLAKKNNGCLPPGQAKRYRVGYPLGDDVASSNLPKILLDKLSSPPKGSKYVRVDNDVLLIGTAGKMVLDAISLGE